MCHVGRVWGSVQTNVDENGQRQERLTRTENWPRPQTARPVVQTKQTKHGEQNTPSHQRGERKGKTYTGDEGVNAVALATKATQDAPRLEASLVFLFFLCLPVHLGFLNKPKCPKVLRQFLYFRLRILLVFLLIRARRGPKDATCPLPSFYSVVLFFFDDAVPGLATRFGRKASHRRLRKCERPLCFLFREDVTRQASPVPTVR